MEYVPNKRGQKILLKAYADSVDVAAVAFQLALKARLTRSGASNVGAGGQSGPSGQPPRVASGHLRRSIQIDRKGLNGPEPVAIVGTNVVYGPIHEFGGVIVPKKAKALAVPIGKAGRQASNKGPLRGQDLTFIPRKGKPPLLVKIIGKGKLQTLMPLFVLLKRVVMPPRPWMRPTMRDPRVLERMADEASKRFAAVLSVIPRTPGAE